LQSSFSGRHPRRPFHFGMRPQSEEARMQTRVLNELRRMNRKRDFIINRLDKMEKEGVTEMAWIDDMRVELANNTSVSQSAVVAVNTLADKGARADQQRRRSGRAAGLWIRCAPTTRRFRTRSRPAPPRSANRRRCRSSRRCSRRLNPALNCPTDRSAASRAAFRFFNWCATGLRPA
jgi:hypothetical protein